MGWWEQGHCRDEHLTLDWFARRDYKACVEVCRGCPVQTDCLLAAYDEESHGDLRSVCGVRGGQTPEERVGRYAKRPGRVVRARRPIEHGTVAGYRAHRYRNEETCQECRDAVVKAKRERRERREAS